MVANGTSTNGLGEEGSCHHNLRDEVNVSQNWMNRVLGRLLTGNRTIGFIVAHATTIANFTKSGDRGIAIVWPLVWQITQAACAVTMSAAPSLAWIQQSFTLSPGGSSRSGVGLFGTSGSQQGSYALASIRKKGSALRERIPKSTDNPKLRPGSGNYTAAILAGPKAPSIASGNSQADLIRCDVQYTVQHEYMVKEDELTALPS